MDFRDYLRRHRNPRQLLDIMAQIINGIQEIHSLGYVHRDLKPDNIVLNLNPLDVRIIDFDRVCLKTDQRKQLALGTPGYFPTSQSWQNGHINWDVWALVAIIFEADMQLDEYLDTKKEADSKYKMRKHTGRVGTSKKLTEIGANTIFNSKKEGMMNLNDI